VAVADGAEPAGVDPEGLQGLPVQVEVPLAVVVAVQRAPVETVDLPLDLLQRPPPAELLEHDRADGAQQDAALQVQPRGVEDQPGQLRGTPAVEPQRQGQAAGGVRRGDDVVVVVAGGDETPGGVQLLVVRGEVGDVVGGLPRQQRPAVLAQVEGVEVVAALEPPRGVLDLEEVVGEPVHVQHGAAGGPGGTPGDQRRDDGPLLVVAEVDGLREPGLPEDVGALRGVVVRARGHGLILAATRSRVRRATSGRLLVTSQARPGRIQ
jgi:hypothetical protein